MNHAKERGVVWNLTFEEWHQWWIDSGHYHERGRLGHQYCMCRINDEGAYQLDNIYCDTSSKNVSDSHKNGKGFKVNSVKPKFHTEETKLKISQNSKHTLKSNVVNERLSIMKKYDFSVNGSLSKFAADIGVSHTQARRFITKYS